MKITKIISELIFEDPVARNHITQKVVIDLNTNQDGEVQRPCLLQFRIRLPREES